jgi:hypothetical protein
VPWHDADEANEVTGELTLVRESGARRRTQPTENRREGPSAREKETDVYLFVYDEDKKDVGKGTILGPTCGVKVTTTKPGKCKLSVRNLAQGPSKVTLEVPVTKRPRVAQRRS